MGKLRELWKALVPSRITRKLVDEPYAWTVFGWFELKMKLCKTCKCWFPLDSFYGKSKRDKKNDDDVREQCITCYDMYKGKDPEKISTPPTNDLMNYFDNGESDERRVSLGREVSTKNS